MERVLAAAESRGVKVVTPRPGESIEPSVRSASNRWWPDVPWQTAAEHPIVSTQVD